MRGVARVEAEGLDAFVLDQAGRGALRQRGGHVLAAVGRGAGPGDEAIARAHGLRLSRAARPAARAP
jgi:hypothetical protein